MGAVALLLLAVLAAPAAAAAPAGSVFGWTEQKPASSPPPRAFAAMAYDGARGEIVLFGGEDVVPLYGDTWTWDGSEWTERTPASSPPPGEGAMAYDAKIGKVVYFAGSETWTWDGSNWTQLVTATSPVAAPNTPMAYDAAREEIVLFVDDNSAAGETWTFDGSEWTQEAPAHDPKGRSRAGMTYDAARQEVVLVGGYHGGGGYFLSETWTWNGSDWTEQSPAQVPMSEEGPALAYDPGLEEAVLFGGWFGLDPHDETWTWNGSDWTSREPALSPQGRFGAAMAYDEAREQMVLFGGATIGAPGRGEETWTYQPYGPPSATITAPGDGRTFSLGQSVPTAFSCSEGASAPGLASCRDSNGSAGPAGSLDTSRLGAHTYTVTALSRDGLSATASLEYTVIAPPAPPPPSPQPQPQPKTRILYSPNHPHAPNRAGGPRYTFHFKDETPGVSYRCRLDGGPFKRCSSPQVYRGLKPGRHVFRVKSILPSGLESTVQKVGFRAGKKKGGSR